MAEEDVEHARQVGAQRGAGTGGEVENEGVVLPLVVGAQSQGAAQLHTEGIYSIYSVLEV